MRLRISNSGHAPRRHPTALARFFTDAAGVLPGILAIARHLAVLDTFFHFF